MERRFAISIAGLATLIHAPSFPRPFMDTDEGSYAAIACRLLAGGLPYRDAVENKTPGVFYIYKALGAAFGRYNMLPIHIAVTLVAIVTAFVVGDIAKRYAGARAAWWAAASYVVFSGAYYPKMLAGNTEMFAVLPATLAVWCYLRARDRASVGWMIAAGACGALALVFKQVATATFCAVLADRAVSGRRELGRAARDIALLGIGFAAVVLALVLHLRALGVLDDARFWTWTYVLHYYMPSGNNDHGFLFNLATCFVLFCVTVSPLLYLAARSRSGEHGLLYWWLAGNVAASWVGGRMYGHYFLLCVPALCVLGGIGAATVATVRERTWLARAIVAIAVPFWAAAACFEGATNSFWSPKPDYREASAYVRARTSADEEIFVWGWFPPLYQAADRCPSTRFVYTHIFTGRGTLGTEQRGHDVPEAWDMLMADLERAPPPYILDTSTGEYRFHFPPESYPRLWRFISAHYTVEARVAGVRMFRRKPGD